MLLASPMKKITALIAIALAMSLVAGCGRQPKPTTSAKLIKSYFKKYGKKYPSTVYAKGAVQKAEINGQQEIHKGLVSADAFLTFREGGVQRIFATLLKGPFGWKVSSWEADSPPVE